MNIYFAGMENTHLDYEYYLRTGESINVLLSYYYIVGDIKKVILSHKFGNNRIMMDSGAFTLFKKPELVSKLETDYSLFLKYNVDFIDEYIYNIFTLDYRDDSEGFEENYAEYLKLRSLYDKIIPVIHNLYKIPINEIFEYQECNPPAISIGKIQGKRSKENFNAFCDSINEIKLKSKCHLLGVTDYKNLSSLPKFDTCDSRSWSDYAEFGQIFFNKVDYNGNFCDYRISFPEEIIMDNELDNEGKIVSLDDMEKNFKDDYNLFIEEIDKNLSIKRDDLFGKYKVEYRKLCNIYYYLKMEKYINRVYYV